LSSPFIISALIALRRSVSSLSLAILLAGVDRLELRSIDGDARCTKQLELAAQHNEFVAHLDKGAAIILAKIRNRLVVRRKASRQPDKFDIALAFPFQAPARWYAVEVAVNIDFEKRRWAIRRPAERRRLHIFKSERGQIEAIHERIDRTNRIVIANVLIENSRGTMRSDPDPYLR
jgi:hypothetical protein